MKMKDRLIELLNDKTRPWSYLLCPANIRSLADSLIEDGVIVPLFKVGDKVYIVAEISEKIVESIVIGVWLFENECAIITNYGTIHNDSIGKTVFLTREEAEKALQGVNVK